MDQEKINQQAKLLQKKRLLREKSIIEAQRQNKVLKISSPIIPPVRMIVNPNPKQPQTPKPVPPKSAPSRPAPSKPGCGSCQRKKKNA